MTDKTGGSAFPSQGRITSTGVIEQNGMTLRDYFAAKAMQAFLADDGHIERVAEYAYSMADAMIAERDKT